MLNQGYIALWSLGYLCLLFAIAFWGDSLREQAIRRYKPVIIGFAVAVYCSAWSFHGVAAQAVTQGWYFPPTFLGPILLMIFFAPLVKKLIVESKRANITSIADYLSVSYGGSRTLGVLITLVSIVVVVPYFALQLKSIAENYHLMARADLPFEQVSASASLMAPAFVAAVLLGVFAMVFGSRYEDVKEHHNGLMMAVAFESIVKLLALVVLALFVSFVMYDGVDDIFIRVAQNDDLMQKLTEMGGSDEGYFTAMILGCISMVCLPRLFHIMAVESESANDINTVRWIFPAYLFVFGVCILLVAYGGVLFFNDLGITSDQYVLGIPIVAGRADLAVLVYLGGVSAASSMVIVACVAISTMASNEIVMPLLSRFRIIDLHNKNTLYRTIRIVRRYTILTLILLGYGYYQLFGYQENIDFVGFLSFSLVAQFFPCLFFSLLLKSDRRNQLAASSIMGIAAGLVVWFYTLFLPELVYAGFLSQQFLDAGPFGISWLRPTALFGLEVFGELPRGVFWSLLANVVCFIALSKNPLASFRGATFSEGRTATMLELKLLLTRFLGVEQADMALKEYPKLAAARGYADSTDVNVVENILSAVVGAISAKNIIETSFTGEAANEKSLDKAAQIFQFGRELLQESIDNISQGISVVDSQLKMVAWNRGYLDIFEYPKGMMHVGCNVADLLRYNATLNGLEAREVQHFIDKRLNLMGSGSAYIHVYTHYTGRVLEIQGAPMGEGGFVTTFTDISHYQETVNTLEETRATLETRVKERTEELQLANRKLRDANHKKTHFLAAAGHDLIQPLNAAKLFATALTHKVKDPETTKLLQNLDHSLHSADTIISELLAIAKLDSGEMQVNAKTFCIGDLLRSLHKEFSIIAQKKNVELRFCYSTLAVTTDEQLLKRILQNLLSNAIRYTETGKVIFGCRRSTATTSVEVWDQGKGIPEKETENIFKEFHRIDKNEQDGGLGLGLATVQRLCQLLDVKIKVESNVGKGSVFRIVLPRCEKRYVSKFEEEERASPRESVLSGMRVLCIDNERTILDGMKAVLETWGCIFHGVTEWQDMLPWEPDALLVDYHLNDGVTGIELAEQFHAKYGEEKPIVVISADQNNDVREQAKSRAYFFLRKPLKAASLWSVLARINDMKSIEGTVVPRQ